MCQHCKQLQGSSSSNHLHFKSSRNDTSKTNRKADKSKKDRSAIVLSTQDTSTIRKLVQSTHRQTTLTHIPKAEQRQTKVVTERDQQINGSN